MRRSKIHGKTSSAEILGTAPARNRPRKWAEHYKRLTALREEFLRGKSTQTRSAREELSSFGEHMADAATDSYDRDCALALLSSTQNALYEVDQALKRIKDGTYGQCELTHKAIEEERLKAIPWTRYCIAAQAEIEARKGAPRVQLGPVGSWLRTAEGLDREEDPEEPTAELEKEAA